MTGTLGPAPDFEGRSQQRVASFFRLHLQLHGPNWRGLGWQSQRSQRRRFAVLSEVGPLANARVLDIGCGVGDLYKYLLRRRIPVTYTGFDILPEMIAHARRRYPEAHFEARDVLQGLGPQRFDYVLCSGAFNVNFGRNVAAVQEVLQELLRCCTRGVAINFLSARARDRDAILFNYEPEPLFAYCRTLTPHVRLLEGYLPNDFTLYLYPEGGTEAQSANPVQEGSSS